MDWSSHKLRCLPTPFIMKPSLSIIFFVLCLLLGFHVEGAPHTYSGSGAWNPGAYLPSNAAKPIDATVNESPASITVKLYLDGSYDIYRKAPDALTWGTKIGSLTVAGTPGTFTDTNVVVGQLYEYGTKTSGSSQVYCNEGNVLAGIKVDQTQPKGRFAVVVASDVKDKLPVEFAQYKADLVADGWVVHEIVCPRAKDYTSNGTDTNADGVPDSAFPSDHIAIRNQLIALYNTYPGELKNVALIGKVPTARSGLVLYGPDGHGNISSQGADAYYADMDGVWTDNYTNAYTRDNLTTATDIPFTNNADGTITLPPYVKITAAQQAQIALYRANNYNSIVSLNLYSVSVAGGVVTKVSSYAGGAYGISIAQGTINVPGDNKFDPDYMSELTPNTNVELGFGRIDFANNVPGEYESLRQYFNKLHRYKTASADFQPRRRAIYRVGYDTPAEATMDGMPAVVGMTGIDLIKTADVPATTAPLDGDSYYTTLNGSYLFYGKGNGGPTFSDGGRAVAWTGLQSHWGYWFSPSITSGQNSMVLRAAENNFTLSYTWSIFGVYYFYHRLGMGYDMGDMMRVSISNRGPNGTYFYGSTDSSALFMENIGDPGLRYFMFPGPTNLTVLNSGGNASLSWTAAVTAAYGGPTTGYHVYRAATADGPFTRITSSPVAGASYVDSSVSSGSYAYMVRAVRLETTGSGTFYNASLGATQSINLSAPPAPLQVATITLPDSNWSTPYSALLVGQGGYPAYSWSLASGNLPPGLTLASSGIISGTSTQGGIYSFTVTATDATGQGTQKALAITAQSNDVRIFYPEMAQYVNSTSVGPGYSSYLAISGPTYSYMTYLRFDLSTLNTHKRFVRARLLMAGAEVTNTAVLVKTALTTDAGDTVTDASITYATRPTDDAQVTPASTTTFSTPFIDTTWDVSSLVLATLANDAAKKVGLHLYSSTPGAFAQEARFSTRYAPLASRPRLIVETTDAPAIAISTPLSNPATIRVGSNLQINATVTPLNPSTVTTAWTQVSGTGTTTFGTPATPSTTATFSAPGDYVIRLTADDGLLQSYQDLGVRVVTAAVTGPISGLVLRLPLDESSGTTVSDASGTGNNGTLNGNPVWSPSAGKIAGALALDGTGDRVTIPDSATLDGSTQLSVSCWVYLTDTTARALVVKRTSLNVNESYTVSIAAGGKPQMDVGKYVAASTNRLTGTTALTLNAWHHVAFVFDGTLAATDKRIQLYIDGFSDKFQPTTVASVPRNAASVLRVGGYDTDPSAFNGMLDEVRIYNRALTVPEVLDLSQAAPANVGPQITLASNSVTGDSGVPFNLSATVLDDGIPGLATLNWSKLTGPGTLTFGDATAAATTGTASAGGSYGLKFTAFDGDITTWAGVSATITGVAGYDAWVASKGLTGPDALETATPAHDGVTNLIKYALGLEPLQVANPATLVLVQIDNGTHNLTLSFTGNATDVTYQVQATSDLTGAWTPIFTSSPGVAPGSQVVQDIQPITTSPKRYMRLHVTRP